MSIFLQITGIINRILKLSQVQKCTRLTIYNTSALPTVLYGCETWAVTEQDKSRLKLGETKFMRRRTKYTRQVYKTNEDTLSEFIINPVVKKIQNYRNERLQHVRRMDRDRPTYLLIYLLTYLLTYSMEQSPS
jgi:hypothetical protein